MIEVSSGGDPALPGAVGPAAVLMAQNEVTSQIGLAGRDEVGIPGEDESGAPAA